MQDALQEVTKELNVQGRMAQKSQAQLEEAQHQNENLESEMMAFKKKCVSAENTIEDLSMRLQENDITVDEYKQRFEDLQTADENKRTEIRLLNKMVKEYSNKAEESEHDFVDLKGKYKEKKHHIEELQKELVLLRSQNAEYENVIVALESTNATDTIDNSSKSRRINELQSLLTETEGVANQKATELETTKQEISRLHEENEQMLEEVKSYQDEWRRLTSLLSNVNHTNHANMDSCKRLETKLDDIEYKVSETNVHIDVCQGDMFSKTEALVRENSLLEQKIAEKSHSIEQSDKFLKESHDNISLLQNTMAELQDRIEELQGKPSTPSNPGTDPSDLTSQIQALSDELEEKNELLLEAKIEKESDESAFKVSLDTIVRSYEDKVESLISESEQKENEIQKLKSELESR